MNKQLLKHWVQAILVTLVFAGMYAAYLYIRRETWSLSNTNKVFGSTAVLLAGFTLLISPLKTTLTWLNNCMFFRREMGVMAFILVVFHIIVSVFFIPTRFNLEYYLRQWIPIGFGVLATLIWAYLAFLSRDSQMRRLGSSVWRKQQSLGARAAVWLILLHVTILKYNEWYQSLSGTLKPTSYMKNPLFTPESFLVFLLILDVVLFRLIFDTVNKFAAKKDQI